MARIGNQHAAQILYNTRHHQYAPGMLNDEERAVLAFERSWWLEPGPKDQAIEFALGLSSAAYYEILRSLVSDRRAVTVDPLTVRRVRVLMGLGSPLTEVAG